MALFLHITDKTVTIVEPCPTKTSVLALGVTCALLVLVYISTIFCYYVKKWLSPRKSLAWISYFTTLLGKRNRKYMCYYLNNSEVKHLNTRNTYSHITCSSVGWSSNCNVRWYVINIPRCIRFSNSVLGFAYFYATRRTIKETWGTI